MAAHHAYFHNLYNLILMQLIAQMFFWRTSSRLIFKREKWRVRIYDCFFRQIKLRWYFKYIIYILFRNKILYHYLWKTKKNSITFLLHRVYQIVNMKEQIFLQRGHLISHMCLLSISCTNKWYTQIRSGIFCFTHRFWTLP
jgi:hypothetical protein